MSLVFLKLGGSLITDKTRPYTARLEMLDALATEIAKALAEDVTLKLLVGHGSGSFGHEAASQYKTRQGVSGQQAWHGFAEVWFQASALNRLVVEAFHRAHLPVVSFSPAASVSARNQKVSSWDTRPIQAALFNGLLPIIQGDVVFDETLGGTILSTEDLFHALAQALQPQRILLAGLEAGVWADFPQRTRLLKEITPESYPQEVLRSGDSAGKDVTGGMEAKVTGMLSLLEYMPNLEIVIFSGERPENIRLALKGENPGTRLLRKESTNQP